MTDSKSDTPIPAIVPVAATEGGGFVFAVWRDQVKALRIYPGQKPDDVLEVIGVITREHMALVTASLGEALAKTGDQRGPK